MKIKHVEAALVFCILLVVTGAGCQGTSVIVPEERVGLLEACSTVDGWYEQDEDGNRIAPRVKMSSANGLLHVQTNRARLRYAMRHPWVAPGADWLTVLWKDYGVVDLDKYHFLVVKIKSKGSAIFFGVNGFSTKAGYTTGTTAVDLNDYDDPKIHGVRPVRLELDLHDNMTAFELEEIKLVSELTDEEREGLIGRGLTIRDEGLGFEANHGLAELERRERVAPVSGDPQEMVIFRDTATGAISTRLTAGPGNDFFGEGGIWSADGAAIRFSGRDRGLKGIAVYLVGPAKVTATGQGQWAQWSPAEPTKLLLVTRRGRTFDISSWDRTTGQSEHIADFKVSQIGGYTEVKRFTKSGKLIIAFRETPYMYVVDTVKKTVKHIQLSTRLKDASLSSDERYVSWANCYTYERRWRDLHTGEEGIGSSYSAGHGCGAVRSFGRHLKLIPTGSISRDRTPGDKIQIWANWQSDVVTDYGSFTSDRQWIFTNGKRGDVNRQHIMVPSADPGAVLRVARYFTKFSWESTTYSRPSPDYTKLVYNENCFGPTRMVMAYTRRTDPPQKVSLVGSRITWAPPARCRELKGYNVYASDKTGRGFAKINDELVVGTSFDLPESTGWYVVTAVEHSSLESMFSAEVTHNDAHTYYFEAERQNLTSPARRFYNGYCNDFQCVRINAGSPQEKARDGVVAVDTSLVSSGKYNVWALVSGHGRWTLDSSSAGIDADQWRWVKLADGLTPTDAATLKLSSRDDALKVDTVMITTTDFVPSAQDPRDAESPPAVASVTAGVDRELGQVHLSWAPCPARDLHHYSVYCGKTRDFEVGNASIIRSVYSTAMTDAGMEEDTPLFYKVVAFDSRANASEPTTVCVTRGLTGQGSAAKTTKE